MVYDILTFNFIRTIDHDIPSEINYLSLAFFTLL
jgi:hypothetical protein